MIVIDGSLGEGGGQVVRSAVALSVLTQKPIQINNVRAKRKKPGLMRQHMTAVRAAATLCGAEIDNVQLGSHGFRFQPGRVKAGRYHFPIGTAGSTTLVLQTILYPLLAADGPCVAVIEGGTHNPKAPTVEFIQRTFVPMLQRMGAEISVRLERRGYVPAGGGRIVLETQPIQQWQPLHLKDGHETVERTARAWVAQLPAKIGTQQMGKMQQLLEIPKTHCFVHEVRDSLAPGNSFEVAIQGNQVHETFSAIGRINVRSRFLAAEIFKEIKAFLAAGVPVGEHLADQLLIPAALAGAGSFYTVTPSLHTHTNMDVIRHFLPIRFETEAVREDAYRISISPD
ncbi:RNA 3'-terminal phosphate cyclase [Acanthopleuribacter pedis]|uniref:RNA 3'-terminal phosphate cyclase n=1 Tax=Acanthopleuribacter pedis TaxID=442870 RepID=A0A8J7U546_9BACT|nr:RNA 3'-terminal phosphate cyclase [Acanthopleuribacter pedis]MBO1318951.1 RNA 3'-terminal phosphate cyclase [Acanthopleuribacter pedis]